MLKSEREYLLKICREREKLAKSQADVRAVQRKAEFESQLAAEYSWDSNETWKLLHEKAKAVEREFNERIIQDFKAMGRPLKFAPSCYVYWSGRGINACKEYCAELRRVFQAKNSEDTIAAKLKIAQTSLEIRTRLMADGLESAEAKGFLETMPTPEKLMPALTIEEVRRLLAPSGEDLESEETDRPWT
jgi:hypothetical protein